MLKKIISSFLVMAIMATAIVSMGASAAETKHGALDLADLTKEEYVEVMDASVYAYMDLSGADAQLKEEILDARNTVIYSQSWCAEGTGAYIKDMITGEETPLPEFYDLFPADWDMPVEDVSATVQVFTEETAKASAVEFYYSTYYPYLSAPPATTISPPFGEFFSVSTALYMYATYLPGAHWNAGFNDTNGNSLATARHLSTYEQLIMATAIHKNYLLRGSTDSKVGSATVRCGFYM